MARKGLRFTRQVHDVTHLAGTSLAQQCLAGAASLADDGTFTRQHRQVSEAVTTASAESLDEELQSKHDLVG